MKKALATTALTVIALAIPALAHDRDDFNREVRPTYTTNYIVNHATVTKREDIQRRDQHFEREQRNHRDLRHNYDRDDHNDRYNGYDRDDRR